MLPAPLLLVPAPPRAALSTSSIAVVLHPLCSHVLEDVRSIADESGCSAIACLPLLAPAAAKGSTAAEGAPLCLGTLTLGFPSVAAITKP